MKFIKPLFPSDAFLNRFMDSDSDLRSKPWHLAHTYICTYMHTCTHTHVHTCTHMHTHTHTHLKELIFRFVIVKESHPNGKQWHDRNTCDVVQYKLVPALLSFHSVTLHHPASETLESFMRVYGFLMISIKCVQGGVQDWFVGDPHSKPARGLLLKGWHLAAVLTLESNPH